MNNIKSGWSSRKFIISVTGAGTAIMLNPFLTTIELK